MNVSNCITLKLTLSDCNIFGLTLVDCTYLNWLRISISFGIHHLKLISVSQNYSSSTQWTVTSSSNWVENSIRPIGNSLFAGLSPLHALARTDAHYCHSIKQLFNISHHTLTLSIFSAFCHRSNAKIKLEPGPPNAFFFQYLVSL